MLESSARVVSVRIKMGVHPEVTIWLSCAYRAPPAWLVNDIVTSYCQGITGVQYGVTGTMCSLCWECG